MTEFLILGLIFCIYMVIKNENTYKKRENIIDVIFYLQVNNLELDLDFNNIEPYNNTLFRLYDWGYENIVDKKTFKKIKHYIK